MRKIRLVKDKLNYQSLAISVPVVFSKILGFLTLKNRNIKISVAQVQENNFQLCLWSSCKEAALMQRKLGAEVQSFVFPSHANMLYLKMDELKHIYQAFYPQHIRSSTFQVGHGSRQDVSGWFALHVVSYLWQWESRLMDIGSEVLTGCHRAHLKYLLQISVLVSTKSECTLRLHSTNG